MKSILIVSALLLAAPSGSSSPGRFVRGVTNPWYPLRPGTTLLYTGVHAAQAGVFMPAHPRIGFSARQEYYKGHAEDHFRVLSLSARVTTPGASSSHAVLTKEWTPLEPGVIDHKYYVRGIGTVLEQTVKGGDERNELVRITRTR